MRNVIVTGCPRAELAAVDELASFGVATAPRAAWRSGELGLDIYGLRAILTAQGVEYLDHGSYQERP